MQAIAVPTPRMGEMIRPFQGIRSWRNAGNGFLVVEIHYTADPNRRGDWKAKAAPKYGGPKSWRWRKEQEIDWTAKSGHLIFLNWDDGVHIPHLAFDPPEHWPRWLLIDPGWTNPTSMIWIAVDTDTPHNEWGYQPVHVYREFYERRRSPKDVAFFAHEMSRMQNRNGQQILEQIEQVIVDPGAKQEHQSAAPEKVDANAETVFSKFSDEILEIGWDVPVDTGNNHKAEAIVETVERLANYWVSHDGVPLYDDDDNYRPAEEHEILEGAFLAAPTLFVHPTCVHTIQEMRKYVWADWASTEVQSRRNDPEKPVDKDDHCVTNLIRFTNELRRLRGDVGDTLIEGLEDLDEFTSRFRSRDVTTVEEVEKQHHAGLARRHRRRRTG